MYAAVFAQQAIVKGRQLDNLCFYNCKGQQAIQVASLGRLWPNLPPESSQYPIPTFGKDWPQHLFPIFSWHSEECWGLVSDLPEFGSHLRPLSGGVWLSQALLTDGCQTAGGRLHQFETNVPEV